MKGRQERCSFSTTNGQKAGWSTQSWAPVRGFATTTFFASIGQPIVAVYHFPFVGKSTIQHSDLE